MLLACFQRVASVSLTLFLFLKQIAALLATNPGILGVPPAKLDAFAACVRCCWCVASVVLVCF